jgi:hypothetical protein
MWTFMKDMALSEMAGAWHGRGMAWAWHGMFELAFTVL